MKKSLPMVAGVMVLLGFVLLTQLSDLRLNRGMTRQDIEARFKPAAPGNYLLYNDRLGTYMGGRSVSIGNFLIATQHVTIRLGPDGTATNVNSRWAWRSKL